MPVPVLANCAFGYLHVHAQYVVHAHAHFTLTTSNKTQSQHALFSHDMHIFDMHISLCPGVGITVGYYRRPKIVSKYAKQVSFPLLAPPPWPQLFDQPPLPSRLPQSQFLSDLGRSSGKIYLPPLMKVSITCKSPSSRRSPLEIDHRTKSTLICSFAPPGPNHLSRSQFLSVLDLVSDKIYLPSLTNALGISGGGADEVMGG